MSTSLRSRLHAGALGVIAAFLFAPLLSPGPEFPASLALASLLVVTGPATWWLVSRGPESTEDQRERFGDAARGYVIAFLVFWGGLAAMSEIGFETVSVSGRITYLATSFGAGYWLGYRGMYRTILARVRDAWVKDLSEEERRELESLRDDD